MEENRQRYMTLDAFRREFFAPGSRPTRASVRQWVDDGKIPAVRLDGRLYVREDDVQAFFAGETVRPHAVDRAKEATQARIARIKAARERLARFGL